MKIGYAEDVSLSFTPREIFLTIIVVARFALDFIQELRRDREFYKFELEIPEDECRGKR